MSRWTRAVGSFLCLLGVAAADTYVVLPFSNLTQNPNLNWIGESIADSVRDTLSLADLPVLERERREEGFRQLGIRQNVLLTRATVIKLAEAVDADQVVYGEFEVALPADGAPVTRGSIKMSAHVLDLRRLRQGPEFSQSGAMEDLARLQSLLCWRALQTLSPVNAPSEAAFLNQRPAVRMTAIEHYVRGLLADSSEQKHKFFTQAVRLEPNFSAPHFRLGLLNYDRRDYKLAVPWFAKVQPNYSRYREALFYLGVCRFHQQDLVGAQLVFDKLSRDIPLNEVWNNFGVTQSRMNQPDALPTIEKVLESEPGDPVYLFNAGYLLWKKGRFDEATKRLRAVLEREPNDREARDLLARCERHSGWRAQDVKMEGLERLKYEYGETAYRQLQSMLKAEKL